MTDNKKASREEVARFVEQQLNWETPASQKGCKAHYGLCELKELLDFIYGKPENESEEINANGKGWH